MEAGDCLLAAGEMAEEFLLEDMLHDEGSLKKSYVRWKWSSSLGSDSYGVEPTDQSYFSTSQVHPIHTLYAWTLHMYLERNRLF